MFIGGEELQQWMQNGCISNKIIYLLGVILMSGYLWSLWLNISLGIYKKTLFPLMLLASGGANHLLIFLSRYIFEKEDYALSSRYALQFQRCIRDRINLVYTYSKGAEVLVLPLSGTLTYGFLLSFTFWTTTVSVITAVVIGTRYGGKKAGFWTGALFCAVPGIMNMAVSAKSDSITPVSYTHLDVYKRQ